MMTRPVFESPDVQELIERIRNEDSYFTIEASPNSHYLELRCVNSDLGQDFRFYMNYTSDLASGIGHEVQYEGGMIMFTDEVVYIDDDEEDVMPISDNDYVISLDQDKTECPVCYETYEPMYGSLCGHNACNDCMIKMDSKGLTKCPMCRSDSFKFPIALACNRSFVNV
jgi:hypothetical protein